MIENKIRFYRLRRVMTQTELADKLGISQQAVAKWETQNVELGLKHAIALSVALKVEIELLFPALHEAHRSTPGARIDLLAEVGAAMSELERVVRKCARSI